MDNLDSYTYEVFEKDPVKYSKYEEVSLAVCITNVKYIICRLLHSY